MHTFVGNLGHLLVIVSFVTALVATFGYWQSVRQANTLPQDSLSWQRFSRIAFYLHSAAVLGIVISLFYIIHQHYYEYHYAYDHSSNSLPVYYMISCFWEGQEGSFLLWIFWNTVLGIILILTNKTWESPLMAIFSLVQAFLVSMILGTVLFGTKIGSSPFMLLREVFPDIPIFQANPNFVPTDGDGLNPLLQNYWMVIHPPTLFLGFATTLIPFAYCIAGLWQKRYSEWIRPALPWSLFSAMVLGVGILMGAYWAYETLSFGGYWSWDPVENAVYVPWIVLIAAIHTMIAYKKSETALKSSIILAIATFILILYATFLTRSGVLGNASVHSFTDLGLSGQLLIYLATFVALAVVLAIVRWKEIPSTDKEVSTYSREFWIFLGATTLCLAGFQVLFTTSIPVYNKIIEAFGAVSNIALPTDAIAHYTKFQLWFAVAIAVFSAIGQFFWWKKIDKSNFLDALTMPGIITLMLAAAVLVLTNVNNWIYIVVLVAAIFTIVSNISTLTGVIRGNYKLSGGSVAHIGIAMMLIGIMYSSGYSKVISLNNTGYLISKEKAFTKDNDKENKENLLLFYNQPVQMGEYQVTYKGQLMEARNIPGYIKKDLVAPTNVAYKARARKDIVLGGKKYYSKGDTLEIAAENTYYQVEYRDPKGKITTLYPRQQINEQMGHVISPDIKHGTKRDLYTHITYAPDPTEEREWSEAEKFTVSLKDTFYINDFVAVLDNVTRVTSMEEVVLTSSDAAVKANIRILGKDRNYEANPTFVIKDGMIGRPPEIIEDLGLKIAFTEVNPKEGNFSFTVNTTQKDYIIMKVLEKPFINVLWIGTLVLVLGFGMAIVRRYNEFAKMRDKGLA
ncbi:MAG: cytochrome c biogenesis protein CcsA [Bacteroidota bacterium]